MIIFDSDNFNTWYRILGVDPGCNWDDIRAAYRRQVQKWHPDRFPENSSERSEADNNIVNITRAYRHLSEHYEKHGVLPGQRAPTADKSTRQSPDVEYAPFWQTGQPEKNKKRSYSRTVFKYAIVCSLVWGIYEFVSEDPSPTSPPYESSDPGDPGSLSLEQRGTSQNPQPPEPPEPLEPSGFQRKFTFGSSESDVLEIQGRPDQVTGNTWHYGKSTVLFRNGAVQAWNSSEEHPLRVGFKASLGQRTPESLKTSRFKLGSTKADVLALQGEPIYELGQVWDYGTSKVYFRDYIVIGWNSSPMDPLKIEQGLPQVLSPSSN